MNMEINMNMDMNMRGKEIKIIKAVSYNFNYVMWVIVIIL